MRRCLMSTRVARAIALRVMPAALVGLFGTLSAQAEVGRDPTYELLRQRQLAQEAQRIEQELANPRTIAVPGDRAFNGPAKAPIALYVFSDFQCPYCSKGAATVEEVKKKYPNKIKVTFLHFPMPMHAQARIAARYFEALALQGSKKAYAFHDKVFAAQEKLTTDREAFLDALAKDAGADMTRLKKDLESEKVTTRIATDEKLAQSLGLTGTPGFVVAGVLLKGAYPLDTFTHIIDERLKKPNRKISSK